MITKHITALFLLVAGLTLVLHNVIPHDHHQPEQFACGERTPLHPEKDHGRSHGFPAHCHAFNDLLSDKFAKFSLKDPGRENFQTVWFNVDRYEVFLQSVHFVFLDFKVPEPDHNYSKLTLFRGPPCKLLDLQSAEA